MYCFKILQINPHILSLSFVMKIKIKRIAVISSQYAVFFSVFFFHSLISSLLSRYEFLVAVFRQNPAFSTDLHALTFLQHFVGINGLLHALHVSLHFQPHLFVNRKQETNKSSSRYPNYCFIKMCLLSLCLTVHWNEPIMS